MTACLATRQQQIITIPFLYIIRSGKSTSALSPIYLTPYHLKNYHSSDSGEMSKILVKEAIVLLIWGRKQCHEASFQCLYTMALRYMLFIDPINKFICFAQHIMLCWLQIIQFSSHSDCQFCQYLKNGNVEFLKKVVP